MSVSKLMWCFFIGHAVGYQIDCECSLRMSKLCTLHNLDKITCDSHTHDEYIVTSKVHVTGHSYLNMNYTLFP